MCRVLVTGLLCIVVTTQAVAEVGEPYRIVRDVAYVRRPDGDQRADLYLPRGPGRFPGVLMVHGGAWMAGNKHHAAWHARRLAERGFAVVSIDYRLAPQHRFPAQLEDCQAALTWMARTADQYPWDITRLAGYGYSAGGHLVCLLGMKQSQLAWRGKSDDATRVAIADDAAAGTTVRDEQNAAASRVQEGIHSPPTTEQMVQLRAIVAGGAPCDFCDEPLDSPRLVFWLGGTREQQPDVYRDASPTRYASPKAPPVFFFHGEQDRVVPLASPTRLFQQLQQQGVHTRLHIVSPGGHLTAYLDPHAFEASVQFLERELRPLSQD